MSDKARRNYLRGLNAGIWRGIVLGAGLARLVINLMGDLYL